MVGASDASSTPTSAIIYDAYTSILKKKFIQLSYQNFQCFFARLFFWSYFILSVLVHFMLKLENLIIVVERNSEQKDRKVKASEYLVANHNCRIKVHCVL